jgi:predicted transcriptional regulator
MGITMSDIDPTETLRFDRRLTVKMPSTMEAKLHQAASAAVSSTSDYARRAIVEKLTRDGFAPSAAVAA